ncbi:MAG: hypothetical protein H6882_13185 [Rhodobiaceae bacterium]|nr:hypothetical protein [Rhodobiaceae bacterium]
MTVDLPWLRQAQHLHDLRFAYLYRAGPCRRGDACHSAAFTKVTGEAHWHVCSGRALSKPAVSSFPPRKGHHENGRDTCGHSLIIDPWGRILAEAGTAPT